MHRCTSARPRNHAVPILNTAKYFGRTPCLRKRKNQLMRLGVERGGLLRSVPNLWPLLARPETGFQDEK